MAHSLTIWVIQFEEKFDFFVLLYWLVKMSLWYTSHSERKFFVNEFKFIESERKLVYERKFVAKECTFFPGLKL